MGTMFGMFLMAILAINKKPQEVEINPPSFDEADIYHAPKYCPRITKEQEQ